MTLNDIIVEALTELGRGHDQMSIDSARRKFTHFANDALCDIAATMKVYKTESLRVNGSTIDTLQLSRPCLKVIFVTQDGFPLKFDIADGSGLICVGGRGLVDVTYRYVPRSLEIPSDVPELPEYMLGLIVTYVVARERMSSDTSTQKGASAYMEIYEMLKARLISSGGDDCYIDNKW